MELLSNHSFRRIQMMNRIEFLIWKWTFHCYLMIGHAWTSIKIDFFSKVCVQWVQFPVDLDQSHWWPLPIETFPCSTTRVNEWHRVDYRLSVENNQIGERLTKIGGKQVRNQLDNRHNRINPKKPSTATISGTAAPAIVTKIGWKRIIKIVCVCTLEWYQCVNLVWTTLFRWPQS